MSIQLTPTRNAAFNPSWIPASTQLEELLLEGLDSGEPVEADESFWNRLRAETDGMVAEHQVRKPHP